MRACWDMLKGQSSRTKAWALELRGMGNEQLCKPKRSFVYQSAKEKGVGSIVIVK